MALADVRYRLTARIAPWPAARGERTAFEKQFLRRAAAGKCFQQPYFGCREFPAYYRLVDDPAAAAAADPPRSHDEDVGWMVYDVFDQSRPGGNADRPAVSLFRARIEGGVLTIPPYDSAEVRRQPSGGGAG